MKKYREVLIKPIVTEKSLRLAQEENSYTLKVAKEAAKSEIKKRIEEKYNVEVLDVRTITMKGKKKRVWGTRHFSNKSNWKKAVVKLADGDEIAGFAIE